MKKNKLLLLPFLAGLVLMVYSWLTSYPLSVDFPGDFVFNHVPILYWVSLPLMLASLFLLGATSKNHYSKWAISVAIIVILYSLSYFYYTLPTSDAQYFRGLTEYFIQTKNLDPSLGSGHFYFQWPFFFLLSDMTTAVSGLKLVNFEFLLYAIIGFLMATALYVYYSKAFKKGGFLAVAAFFMAMFYFLNYQSVPFSLAFGLLLLLFMLETRQKNFGVIMIMIVLFTGISFTHAIVPLFFIFYLLMRCVLNRSKQYGFLLVATLIIYLLVTVIQAPLWFLNVIRNEFVTPSEYYGMAVSLLEPVSAPFDAIASIFSRFVTIATVIICFASFAVLLIKRKLKHLDIAVFLTGALLSALGILFFYIGSRAAPIALVPVCLGAAYLFESKFRRYLKPAFLILLIFFAFIPLHSSFTGSEIKFQTKADYQTENFLIDNSNWTRPSLLLSHFRVETYLETKQPSVVNFESDLSSPLFPRIKEYDCIVYTVGLGINLLKYNYTADRILNEEGFNVIYNSGSSFIITKG